MICGQIFGWYVGDIWMICWWYVDNMWVICGWYLDEIWVICGWYVGDMKCGWYCLDIIHISFRYHPHIIHISSRYHPDRTAVVWCLKHFKNIVWQWVWYHPPLNTLCYEKIMKCSFQMNPILKLFYCL